MPLTGLIVIDFEITGFSPQEPHRVIEVGLMDVLPDGVIEREFETVTNPGRICHRQQAHRAGVPVAQDARFETIYGPAEVTRLSVRSGPR
jgi:DNA polymerase III epsilon subunit-like protein